MSLHLQKCLFVGNHMSRLNYFLIILSFEDTEVESVLNNLLQLM